MLRGDAAKADDLGVGVAQGAHPAAGDDSVWVVVLYAQKPDAEPAKPHGSHAFDPHPM